MEEAELTSQVKRSFDRYRYERSAGDIAQLRGRVRVTRRSLAVGVTAVAAVALWALNATPFVGSPQAAFAGWQPVPTTADRTLAEAAKGPCLADASLPAMSLVAQDQRGNAATLLFAGGGELSICLVLRDNHGTVVATASGVSHLEDGKGSLTIDSGLSSPKNANSAGLRIIAGRVAPSVKAVKVSRTDGVIVDATVNSGYFVAWWPTEDKATIVTATDSSGNLIAVVPG